jgi:hypothetical protein
MTGARQLGRFGVWRSASLVTPQLAADIERLGFGTLWLGSSPAGDLVQAEELLDATTTLTLATSIVNMWQDQPEDVAGSFARVEGAEFFTAEHAALLKAMLERIDGLTAEIGKLSEVIERLLAPYEEQLAQAGSMPG